MESDNLFDRLADLFRSNGSGNWRLGREIADTAMPSIVATLTSAAVAIANSTNPGTSSRIQKTKSNAMSYAPTNRIGLSHSA